jgi:hypothetical protein
VPKSEATTELVLRRARYRCEYCQVLGWPLTLDHVLPPRRGGSDSLDNLAAACFPCNRLKSDRTTATDPLSGEPAPLFNPRTDIWHEHFAWSTDFLDVYGRTAVGRAMVALLRFHRSDRRRPRRILRLSMSGGGLTWP